MMIDTFLAMPSAVLAAFTLAGVILNLTPGADVMFATACGVQGGPRAGVAAGLGVGLGGAVHVALAALGLSVLLTAHPGAMAAIRWAGAGYLLWLAVQAWRSGGTVADAGAMGIGRAFRRGLITNLLNPKTVIFILAFLPQFTDPARGPVGQQMLILGSIFVITGTLITAGYGATAGWLGRALADRMAALNKLAAVVFAGLAAKLVTS